MVVARPLVRLCLFFQAAHDWYVNNEDHRKLVDAYRSGGLDTFSSVLARLQVGEAS